MDFVPVQRELIKKVIENDRLVWGFLVELDRNSGSTAAVCDNPGHCAVGALLSAAGVSDEKMLTLSPFPSEFPSGILELLYLHYGLTVTALTTLADVNDRHSTEERTRNVLQAVDTLEDGIFETREEEYTVDF